MPAVPSHLPELLAATSRGGPGVLLKWVIVIVIVGVVFLAWFLLRGYKDKD
ncbi:hypothetical protein [Wenjunlia tyrosinilytica]|uniref:Uncharacterized protein n=1 Tax=Wenjunlia tyrosinilytica TaxID=1544741 RepID=A0A917ZDK9_9ACTN|nr:hypothetical protein [Wenjunlia tyrosinilytica]GGO80836.1 hypothetical protein GCM10012280_03680 [Wenjunlia tyrosinilytica]